LGIGIISHRTAEELHIATVMVFLETLEQIKPLFEQETGHTLVITYDSAGSLVREIKKGEPIDVFLSSDEERPNALISEGLAIPESFFVYRKVFLCTRWGDWCCGLI